MNTQPLDCFYATLEMPFLKWSSSLPPLSPMTAAHLHRHAPLLATSLGMFLFLHSGSLLLVSLTPGFLTLQYGHSPAEQAGVQTQLKTLPPPTPMYCTSNSLGPKPDLSMFVCSAGDGIRNLQHTRVRASPLSYSHSSEQVLFDLNFMVPV